MQILVADKIAANGVDFLKAQEGFEVIEAYGSSKEALLEIVPPVSAIVVRSDTRIDADIIAAAPELKVVGRAGVGVDNIDIEAATERGIVVVNTPGGNTIATAELTFTHMLSATRPVAQAQASMSAGRWDRKTLKGAELMGKTLAILGLGRIGSEVAKRAQAFGMTVVAYDPYLTETRAKTLNIEKKTLEEIWPIADYITVHMPLTDTTRNMVDRAAFSKMKDGVRIINCARGGLINEQALIEAVDSGKVAAAGLDVYETEPLPEDDPLRNHENIILTPHLGASTVEAQLNVGVEIAETVTKILVDGQITNAVNMPSIDAKTLKQLTPYLKLGNILGTMVQQITPDSIAKLEITYFGKLVELDTMPLTRAIQRGYLKKIMGDTINDVNSAHKMKNLGIEVEIKKSNVDTAYSELIQVTAVGETRQPVTVEGTLMGKALNPRIVGINGKDLEITPQNTILLIENQDMPGMVGFIGGILGKHQVNIANMALNRDDQGEKALTVFELDSEPGEAVVAELKESPKILSVDVIDIGKIS